MEISSADIEQGVRIELSGEVDMHNSPKVREALLAAAEKKAELVIVDLTNVDYIDSSGLATLVELLQHLSGYGGKMALVGATKSTRDVFSIARLDKVFTFFDTDQEAITAAANS